MRGKDHIRFFGLDRCNHFFDWCRRKRQNRIAEAPLHPIAARLYDTTIRGEFLDFARELAGAHAVRFLPIESSGPYEAADFVDLTHLSAKTGGSAKLTRAIVSAVRELLPASGPGEETAGHGAETPARGPGAPRNLPANCDQSKRPWT